MEFVEGEAVTENREEILDAMITNAKEYFDEDLDDSDESVIRAFYTPVANQFAIIQNDIGFVLESTQIDNAEGVSLDLLTALIGVQRNEASTATGQVRFSREEASDSTDYHIPNGTYVQTSGLTPIRFETTEAVTLEQGTTYVDAPIEAVDAGAVGNVAANTITSMPDPPTGIEDVTNHSATTGGEDAETDDQLRQRAKTELSEGARATQIALITSINNLVGVENVSIFTNSDHNLGDHPGFELVVHGGNENDIGQEITETKAAGEKTYGGEFGQLVEVETELPNGQTIDERFSRPQEIDIYVDASLETDNTYQGDDVVINSIVDYIGGINADENNVSGRLSVGDDVLIGEVEYAIREVEGVYDVESLFIDTTQDPNSENNIFIDDFEVAITNALEEQISITS